MSTKTTHIRIFVTSSAQKSSHIYIIMTAFLSHFLLNSAIVLLAAELEKN
ncbi:hypothetical protein SAMN04489723_109156 [Algoriphagus aquimarinus]|uniref:Uncharacterized protein n=1 Tax=Algoriphagus aquimarinus TaxID=237018 RepID=A0A1I1AUY1_9BACT|nr:hypothetical protein SAMN04489723_109156 [Algoriphagus aquimarinus]